MYGERISTLKKKFFEIYGHEAEKIIISPGRAEIIGNHTDYNNGYALAACIENTIVFLSSKREDKIISACSTNFNDKVVSFEISNEITPDETNTWNNYLRGVTVELLNNGYNVEACDILIDSNVPLSGGVSSSAALELGVAYTILPKKELSKDFTFRTKIARICQLAENKYINSPCGFLDQAAVALGDEDKMVFLDFQPKDDMPISDASQVPADLDGYEFILSVDPSVKRQLGLSGYPARRKMCEDSLPIWSELLNKEVKSLRDVSVEDFEKHRAFFEESNPTMRKRIEHVIFENERVLKAKEALKSQDIATFGRLLSESGKSALELYELDEKTPELTYLLHESLKQKGVIGSRNMGGGFSAIIITLVDKSLTSDFMNSLSNAYNAKFGVNLEFIKFKAGKGIYF